MDENGSFTVPDAPNGYKFETLVLDMVHLQKSCLPYEVIREKEEIEKEYLERSVEPAHYGEKIVIIDDGEGQLRDKVLPYAAVPGVVKLIRPDENGKMPSEEELRDMIEERTPDRVVDMR